jgi:hypothetical protein
MSDLDLFDAVAIKTGEDTSEIRRRGFLLDDPADAGLDHDPDCLFDLIDLPETGTVDWDEVLAGQSFREPFYTRTLKARRKSRAYAGNKIGNSKTSSSKKQVARAA